ncbi:MAG: ABC-type transport auxiliary lipoprotein family protein [Thermoanaerobaculia bacterium]
MRAISRRCALAQAAAVFAATGCLFRPATVPQSFSIDPPAPQSAARPGGVVIALARVDVAPPYSGQSLIYRRGEHGLERDPYARFAAPPGWLLTVAIRGYLANADFVRDVVAPGDSARSEATVEVAVSKMAGELRPGGSSAALTLRFRVLSNPGGTHETSEILLKTYSATIPIRRATAQDVVSAWNQGLANIMAEFQVDLQTALTAARAPSGNPGSTGAAASGRATR